MVIGNEEIRYLLLSWKTSSYAAEKGSSLLFNGEVQILAIEMKNDSISTNTTTRVDKWTLIKSLFPIPHEDVSQS
jgi:hypothetical protein